MLSFHLGLIYKSCRLEKSLKTKTRLEGVAEKELSFTSLKLKGATSSLVYSKKLAKLFKIIISNPCQSSPVPASLVPLCFGIASCQAIIFMVFQHLNCNLGHQRSDSKYPDVAPLSIFFNCTALS